MTMPTIRRIELHGRLVWEVCANGMCRMHEQDWQAKVFYLQMLDMYQPKKLTP